MTISIRTATAADVEAIARVDLYTHIEAYRPLLGENYLRGVSIEETEDHWRKVLAGNASAPELPDEVLIAERDGAIVAYSGFGASRDEDAQGAGEVFTLYVHPSAWRTGIGSRLLAAATARLRELGYAEVTLWVMDTNERAQAFYESQG